MTETAEAPAAVEAPKPDLSSGDPTEIATALKQRREAARQAAEKPAPEKDKPAKAEKVVEKKAEKAEPQRPTAEVKADVESEHPEKPTDPEADKPTEAADEAKPEVEAAEKPEKTEAKFKVLDGDGKEVEVSESEVRSGYMRQADYTRKTQALAEERNAFQRDLQQFSQTRDNTLAEMQVVTQMLVKQLVAEESDGKLAELRTVDPAEFAARMAQRQEKVESLRRALAVANQARQAENESRSKKAQEQFERLRADEDRKLVMAMPHWADKNVRDKGLKETQDYLVSQGFTKDEVSQLVDHRSTLLARKAMAYDRLMAAKDTAKVEKREVEKVAKPAPTAPADRKDTFSAKVTSAQDKLRRSGSVDDAAQLLKLKRQQTANQLRR